MMFGYRIITLDQWNTLHNTLLNIAALSKRAYELQEAAYRSAIRMEKLLMAVSDDIKALTTKVQAENTVISSVGVMLDGLRKQIIDLQSQVGDSAPAQAAIADLAAAIDAGASQLASAAASNSQPSSS